MRFTTDHCAVVFLDYTPSVLSVGSIEAERLENNVIGLTKVARELGMPVVISIMQAKSAALADPLSSGDPQNGAGRRNPGELVTPEPTPAPELWQCSRRP